jgi:DNA-packaging protein gp3
MKTKKLNPGNTDGRPPKYVKESFEKKLEDYIEERKFWKEKGPITILDFCVYAEVYKDFISEHDKNDGSDQDFSEAIKKLRTEAERSTEYFAMLGKINPTMAIFSLKNNFGWKDKHEFSGPDGQPLKTVEVKIINSKHELTD